MVSVLKRGGGHHKNGTGVMSTSFTVQSMPESDYVDDGKFSSDDDASPFPVAAPKKSFCMPVSSNNSNTNLLKTTLVKNDLSNNRTGNNNNNNNNKCNLARKNSAPVSHVARKNLIPPPLPPQKPKIPTGQQTSQVLTLAAALKNHSLVRSESAPTANVANGFKIAKETLAAELSQQNKCKPDFSIVNMSPPTENAPPKPVANGMVKNLLPPSSNPPLPPPPGHSTLQRKGLSLSSNDGGYSKKMAVHRSHSCAMSAPKSSSTNGSVKNQSEEDLLEDFVWFHSSVSRRDAEQKLINFGTEGAFLLRYKSEPVPNVPYSLSVYKNKVYHLEIRQKQNGNYALGDPKPDELEFSCLQALVNFHKRKPLQLVRRSTTQLTGSTLLTASPPK